MRLGTALSLAVLLRVVLIFWSFHQDKGIVKYTDVDYTVFTDAARCLIQPSSSLDCTIGAGPLNSKLGMEIGDPYARDTYRYTPLLALLVTPNLFLHHSFGKVLFSISDLLVGLLLVNLLRLRGVKESSTVNYVTGIWLLNPMIANISTRGSSESLVGVLIVGVLVLASKRRWNAAAVVFGLAVHFKVFPVIYGSSIYVALGGERRSWWLSRARLQFGLVSFATFMLLNSCMYAIWGHPFIVHTFLYHITRLDHRHNFSPYFYPIYLSGSSLPSTLWDSIVRHPLASFVPQFALALGLGFKFGKADLPLAWFLQTFAFVNFNKVCTSQYFLWYLWLLPPVLPVLTLSRAKGFSLIAIWVLGQVIWLSQAYRLEMLGEAVYRSVWFAGILYFVSSCYVLSGIMHSVRLKGGEGEKVKVVGSKED